MKKVICNKTELCSHEAKFKCIHKGIHMNQGIVCNCKCPHSGVPISTHRKEKLKKLNNESR